LYVKEGGESPLFQGAVVHIKEFEYTKENGEKSFRKVLVLSHNEDTIEGIELKYLNEAEQKKLISLQKIYEDKLKQFMKAYRKFFKNKMEMMNEEVI
jgi:hypothetical protein